MPASSFLTPDEIAEMGFKAVGHDAKISRKASFYHCESISIGSHVRIDDFCVMSCSDEGRIDIGDYVHISTHCLVIAPGEVRFEAFSGISSGCRIFGGSDDYGGEFLTNPCVPERYRKRNVAPVILERHAVVGAGTTILYGVTIGECSAVGSMSLVLRDIPPGQIHAGIPAKYIRERSRKVLELERQLREEEDSR
jgi:acetyltransferase-like isoleucine patch superfamily enzyme